MRPRATHGCSVGCPGVGRLAVECQPFGCPAVGCSAVGCSSVGCPAIGHRSHGPDPADLSLDRVTTSGAGGFTLIEVVIATALLLLAMALASGLLHETAQLLAEEQRAARDVSPELTLAQLRADVQRSRGVRGGAGGIGGGLELALRGGGALRWHVVDGALVREVVAASGTGDGGRIQLPAVEHFAWSSRDGCLVDLAITWLDRDRTPRWTAPRPEPTTPRQQTLSARITCRDRPHGDGF